QQGHQYTAGIIFKDRSWLLDIDAYYRTIDGITSLTFGFLNPADPVLHQGSGFTKGVDVLLQKSTPTWKAWATYTYQDAQNKFDQINNGNYFDTNAGIRHHLSVSCYKKWDAFALARGWFWRTGRPYSTLNASNQISVLNSEQLPVYHRLDLSAIYQFKQSQKWSGKIGVSFYNVYDRRTVISREYERIYTNLADVVTTKFRVQDYQSLGFMPNLFLRIAF
ncbi:MAG: TonB-dependent receptor domain-containing protein, partial [Bacteroidota bacterium]